MKVSKEIHVISSKKRPGNPHPKCFLGTDIPLSAQPALSLHLKPWPVEVDNLHLTEVLGLGNFRLQSFEAIQKWFARGDPDNELPAVHCHARLPT